MSTITLKTLNSWTDDSNDAVALRNFCQSRKKSRGRARSSSRRLTST
jgi:hypothetical protein